MADTDKAKEKVDDVRKTAEKESARLSNKAREVAERTSSEGAAVRGEASGRARAFAGRARVQAHDLGGAMRENPAATATALTTFGLMCFGLGLVIGSAMSDERQ